MLMQWVVVGMVVVWAVVVWAVVVWTIVIAVIVVMIVRVVVVIMIIMMVVGTVIVILPPGCPAIGSFARSAGPNLKRTKPTFVLLFDQRIVNF
jgi:hypothetical protein